MTDLKNGHEPLLQKPRVLITFREGSENGGPYVSHLRILQSSLRDSFEMVPLDVPLPRVLGTKAGDLYRFFGHEVKRFLNLNLVISYLPKKECSDDEFTNEVHRRIPA